MKNKKIILLSSVLVIPLVVSPIILSSCAENNSQSGTIEITLEEKQYLQANSLSLLSYFEPNIDYIKNITNTLNEQYLEFEKNPLSSNNAIKISQYLTLWLNYVNQGIINLSPSLNLGTGWIFDYSIDPVTNLTNYYIATNAHVMDWTLDFEIFTNSVYNINLQIPVNIESTKAFKLNISQPLIDKPLLANNPITWNNVEWFDSKLTLDDFSVNSNNCLPIGQLDSNNEINWNEKNSYDFSFKISYPSAPILNQTIYAKKDTNDKYVLTSILDSTVDNSNLALKNNSSDFQILKLSSDGQYAPISSSINGKIIENSLFKLFSTNQSLESIDKNSSYITKLRYLISLLNNESNFNVDEFKKWFLFTDYNNISNSDKLIFGGFAGSSNQQGFYSTFQNSYVQKSNTTSLINSNTNVINRNSLSFNYQGKSVISNYDYKNNVLMNNAYTDPGSSGSMVLSNNRLVGIYWGILTKYSLVNDQTSIAKEGIFTPIFNSDFTKDSILKKYLSYIYSIDKNSNLLNLFVLMKNKNLI